MNTRMKTSNWSVCPRSTARTRDVSYCYHRPPLMTATDIALYAPSLVRWEPNARGRLEQAALELYRARGYDSTTVAEIAERAGLTERTFFRYFTDKREVLFGGSGA